MISWFSPALTFASDFKLGHYMKVPPRPMFWAQVAATAVAGTVQLGVQSWMFSHIPYVLFAHRMASSRKLNQSRSDICQVHQKDNFICPSTEVFGTASIIVSSFLHGTRVYPYVSRSVGCYWASSPVFSRPGLLVSKSLISHSGTH